MYRKEELIWGDGKDVERSLKPVKEELFQNYFGEVKSLGAWGGDFVMVTGNNKTVDYFKEKGYNTILSYNQMVL